MAIINTREGYMRQRQGIKQSIFNRLRSVRREI